MFKKIVVCVDGSDRALEAAKLAAELARIHQAALIALHVAETPQINEAFPGAPMLAKPLVERYLCDLHRAVMDRTLPVINDAGVFCETEEAFGEPVYQITRFAEAHEVDLIVMGTRGLNAAHAEQLGSVSFGVAHSAHCPVLLAK